MASKSKKTAPKKLQAKKPAKKAAPTRKAPAKKPVKKATPAKKAPPKTNTAPAKKAPAKKSAPPAKNPAPKKVDVKVEEPKKVKKSPPKMKKMVIKPTPVPVQEELFENDSKDFAFAFAESMKREQLAADEMKAQVAGRNVVRLPKRPTTRAKGSETLRFSDSDLAQFRKSLIALRMSIVGKTATLKTNALEQTIDRAGEDEDGSDSFMRLQNLGQVGEQNKTLQKIDEALHRIEDGSYGICEVCGQLIRKPRLQHLPFAHTCMECQSEMESNPDSRG